FPGFRIVGRGENVDAVIVGPMAVKRDIRRACAVFRSYDSADIRALRNARHLARNVFPGFSAVPALLYVPIIGPSPQHIGAYWRLADGGDGRILLDSVVAR